MFTNRKAGYRVLAVCGVLVVTAGCSTTPASPRPDADLTQYRWELSDSEAQANRDVVAFQLYEDGTYELTDGANKSAGRWVTPTDGHLRLDQVMTTLEGTARAVPVLDILNDTDHRVTVTSGDLVVMDGDDVVATFNGTDPRPATETIPD